MKKVIVPIIFTGLVLMGFGVMSVRAYFYIDKNQHLEQYKAVRSLSLKEVRLTNIEPQPDIDYSIVYTIKKFSFTEGVRIRRKTDTVQITVRAEASCGCKEGPKPVLPKPLYWGKLDWR